MKRRKTVTDISAPQKQLSSGELLEYRLRKTTLDYSRNQFMMVEEAFEQWCIARAKALGITGKFNIDFETGAISMIEGVAHGRS